MLETPTARPFPVESPAHAADRLLHLVPSGVNQHADGASRVQLSVFATEHSTALTRFAYVLCGDRGRAEDLVQEAFVALYRRFGESMRVTAPLLHARQVIVNANISHWRRRTSGEQVLADLPDVAVDPTAFSYDDRDAMWRALSTLSDRQRAVLVLRYYLDLTDREIGELLGCREGSVRSLATRAFAALRTHPDFLQMGATR